ncbi:MAG TPA: BamA/TamA family outer membrane protein [Acidobacteriota bacterium]|nr:BamA/TamA family outer membrane protein [Acidobacteriota bacterium]
MRVSLLIPVVLLITTTVCVGVEMTYEGTPPAKDVRLERYLKQLQQAGVRPQDLADSAAAHLRDAGYLEARAVLAADTLVVAAESRYRLERFVVTADSTYEFSPEGPFTRDHLGEAVDRLLDRYRDMGYFYATARVSAVSRHSRQVTVDLQLEPGPVVTIADNTYTGLTRTRADLVSRYLPVGRGDTLRAALIEQCEQAAEEIGFVRFERPVGIRPLPGYTEADLDFTFQERKQVGFEGGGGYVPDDAAGLLWHLNLSLRNLFGDGREIAIRSDRRQRGRTILDVGYRQPLFLLGVGQATLNVATRDYRDQFYEFSLSTEYTTRILRSYTSGLGLGWKRVEPADAGPGYSRVAVDYSLGATNLDNRYNPSGGLALAWRITYAYRQYSATGTDAGGRRRAYNETRNDLALALYFPLASPLVVHCALNYSGLETAEPLVPESELTFVGGPGTIRGFRNEQFVAQRTAFGTLEPRLRFAQAFVFAFCDAAYINRPVPAGDGVETDEFYRFGYGLGFAVLDSRRSLKVSIGWNRELSFDQPRLSIELATDL